MSAVDAPSPRTATHGVHPAETPSPDRKLPIGHRQSSIAWLPPPRVVAPPGQPMQP